jgi:DNA-binding transcriptional LysR family regulator
VELTYIIILRKSQQSGADNQHYDNSSLKKKFIYCPQLTTSNIAEVIHFLREDSHVEIEHHDILITAESAENLLAYRKADLVITTAPVSNRSIICSPFKTIETVLVCNKNHPRINGESTLEKY